jgi:uncharacterized protein
MNKIRIALSVLASLMLMSCSLLEVPEEISDPADPRYNLLAPTLTGADALTDRQIKLTWENNEEYTQEYIIRRKSGSGSFASIDTVTKDELSYSDTNCTLGVSYSYVVLAKVELNLSGNSDTLTAATAFPAPTGIVVTPISDESLQIVWTDNSSFELGFRIERNDGSGFTEIGTVSADVTEYTDTGLIFGQSYEYRLAAYTSVNTSMWATIAAATEFPAPTDLAATSVSDSEIQLNWTDNTGYETGFKVERNDGSGFTEIGTVSADVTEYTDTGLIFGQSYDYRIAAYTLGNSSTWSTITADTEFPAPTNLSAISVSDSELHFTWTDNTGYEVGFKIERDDGSGFTEIGTVSSDVTEYTDTGLTLGQSYDYRVAAYSSVNTSSWVTITAATEFPAPTNLSAISVSDSELHFTWTDNTGYEVGFKIERDDGVGFTEIGTVSSDVTEYTDTGLTLGQSYDYRVAAYSSVNTSSWVTITAATEFPAPSNLTATAISDTEIELSWTDNCSFEAGYRIERDDGVGFTEIGTVSSDVTEYTDTGLTLGQSYDYRVAAYSSVNTSSWVTITAATEFPAPTNLTATAISDTEIELSWTDNCSFEAGCRIERDAGSGFTEIGTVSSDVTEYTDTGLTLGQSYSYRIAAYTENNTSDYSTTASAITSLLDYDGNVYQVVQIGNQVWVAENLKVTHYEDGTAITNVTDDATWGALTTEAYCIFNNNASNEVDTYGALYNWYAATDSRNIAPAGWHVPTDDEWKELEMYLGMSQSEADTEGSSRGTNEGSKLADNANLWNSGALENDSEFGSSGFTALPVGYRSYNTGNFLSMGQYADFWSATEGDSSKAWYRTLNYNDSGVSRYDYNMRAGFAIRLVRD